MATMSGPKIGKEDQFESMYKGKFRSLAEPHGLFLDYEIDRAGVDLGIHLTEEADPRYDRVTDSRVWFQLKGIQRATLSKESVDRLGYAPITIRLEHLKFWYAAPEVIYLVVYVESLDSFLAEDVRSLVVREFNTEILAVDAFPPDQKTVTLHMPASAVLDDSSWERMKRHRSMRVDGPTFRGRPLGHHLDPFRCELAKMEPAVFSDIIHRLLSVHRYEVEETLDATGLFPGKTGDIVELTVGTMFHTYEWVWHMSSMFAFDGRTEFREEGKPLHVQGPCAVLIHSQCMALPDQDVLYSIKLELAKREGVKTLIIFANDIEGPDFHIGSWIGGFRRGPLQCMPHDLADLAYNILTATVVYLEFCDRISWNRIEYLE